MMARCALPRIVAGAMRIFNPLSTLIFRVVHFPFHCFWFKKKKKKKKGFIFFKS